MKAVGFTKYGSLDEADCLVDFDLPRVEPSGQDLLVRVKAVAVNPVDTKIRAGWGGE